jgi:hypothetical protein
VLLLLQPLQTRVIGNCKLTLARNVYDTQIEPVHLAVVEEMGPQGLEHVNHSQKRQQAGSVGVNFRDSKATGWNTGVVRPLQGMAETAS